MRCSSFFFYKKEKKTNAWHFIHDAAALLIRSIVPWVALTGHMPGWPHWPRPHRLILFNGKIAVASLWRESKMSNQPERSVIQHCGPRVRGRTASVVTYGSPGFGSCRRLVGGAGSINHNTGVTINVSF